MSAFLRRVVLHLHQLATGRQILARLEELKRTQWLGQDELLALQHDKLQRLVKYAHQYVPYYQRIFDQAGFHPDDLCKDIDALRKLPILTKAIIRENFDEMVTIEPRRQQQMSKLSTSGSTGLPLIFMQDNDFRDYVTADIQRHMGWAGWEIGHLQALIWGTHREGSLRQSLRARIIDWMWNRFRIDAFVLTDETMATFAEQIQRQHPRILFGYATSLYRFAQFIRQGPCQNITFDGIFSSAVMLLPAARQFIEETFQCKVFDRYASLELGGIACECEAHTGLHISAENNYVEILCDGHPAEPGEEGSIIVTNLNNFGMPFIRYSVDDRGAWYDGEKCPCGRNLPLLRTLVGRRADMFQTRDGRMVLGAYVGAVFSYEVSQVIRQFQVVQKSLDQVIVRLVRDGEVPSSVLDEIVHGVELVLGGGVEVKFEFPDGIPTLPSGKRQYTISELNKS